MQTVVKLLRKILIFLLFSTNVLYHNVSASFNSTSLFKFQRYTSRDKGITLIGQSWPDKSATSCSINAVTKYPEIRSFLYNVKTKECRPGGEVNATGHFPTQEESLYFNAVCQSSKGFHLISYNNTKACIGVFNQTLNYTEAVSACKEKQSFLMSLKNTNKLEILRNEVSSHYSAIWVGLDDMVKEGTFTWTEDFTTLNETLKGEIFYPTEPNNGSGNEDCVQYVSAKKFLNDDNCYERQPYACEQTVV